MRSWWKMTIVGLFLISAAMVWVWVLGLSSNQPGYAFNKDHNAIWIGHEWVGDSKGDSEVQNLVLDLKSHDIDTVFVHVGPLKPDGTVDPVTYQYAVNFVDKANRFDSSIHFQAWLGQVRSKIDLSDEKVRHNIVSLCTILTRMVGFNGIHFDIEPVWDEDADFINLLKDVREEIPEQYTLSVALAEFIPQSFLWFTEHVFEFENYNSEVNYKNVAKYADQIIVMVYDTGIDHGFIYRWFVKEQTIRVTNLIPDKEVFIAIPAYEDEKEGFNPDAENVKNGLAGIVSGLNNIRSNEDSFAGVAIYPYWEIDENEWETYDNLWLK
ncbi:MAG: glycosyl hydrolase family 18 protein [Candidatus Peregrinibacteria bacterium]